MERTIRWKWDHGEIELGMDEDGQGRSVVLLPALSSISTRREMYPLFGRFSSRFHVSTVDWPGFGDRARPHDDWSPEILSAFLNWFLTEIVPPPHAIVAAGHAATYALYQAAHCPPPRASWRRAYRPCWRLARRSPARLGRARKESLTPDRSAVVSSILVRMTFPAIVSRGSTHAPSPYLSTNSIACWSAAGETRKMPV